MDAMNFTSPALMFPALSLILLAYTNRFLGLSNIIRSLYREYESHPNQSLLAQIHNLRIRTSLIRSMQILGTVSMILCVASIFALYLDYHNIGRILFGICLFFMLGSFIVSLFELKLSTHALNILLSGMEKQDKKSR